MKEEGRERGGEGRKTEGEEEREREGETATRLEFRGGYYLILL